MEYNTEKAMLVESMMKKLGQTVIVIITILIILNFTITICDVASSSKQELMIGKSVPIKTKGRILDRKVLYKDSSHELNLIPSSLLRLASGLPLDDLEITYPNGGEILNGTITIQWTLASPLTIDIHWFQVSYSPNGGNTWFLLVSYTNNTTYIWDTSLHPDGNNYLIQVIAESKVWGERTDVSDGFFTIDNHAAVSSTTTSSIQTTTSNPISSSGNTDNKPNYPINQLFVLFGSFIVISGIGSGYFVYNTRLRRQETFAGFFQSSKVESLKEIRHKVIIGLDNIKTEFITESPEIPRLGEVSQASMVEYFPTDIRSDLRSKMRGKTVLTLIEIAYQNPSETNPVKLSESLDIPPATLSREIKKLIDLQYVKAHISTQVLHDARYRNFTITPKGFKFLSILNDALLITIDRLKEKKIGESTYLGN